MENLCYDCGKIINEGDMDKEHIPAQCFYVGYGNEYKQNRITVVAHKACNHKYSKIDQELRDAIGIMTNNQTDKTELTSKSARSILRRKDGIERISSNDGAMFVNFNYSDLRDLHIKNFKGIFYKNFGMPIPEKYRIEIITEGDQDIFPIETVQTLYHSIDQNILNWNISGHIDIFKYKIAVIDSNGLSELNINTNEQIILCIMVYHEEIICFGFATTQNMIDQMAKK
jgi:hypothetical protein